MPCMCRYPGRPEDDVIPLELELQTVAVSCLTGVLELNLAEPSRRAASTLTSGVFLQLLLFETGS